MGRASLRLRHVHLPSSPSRGVFPTYHLAAAIQDAIRRRFLLAKDAAAHEPPPPTLLSFTPTPTYTLGRRQGAPSSLSAADLARLSAPLTVPAPSRAPSPPHERASSSYTFAPEILESPRGGLTTYHGPGQLVLWPVLDLRSPRHAAFTVRCYARALEATTAAALRRAAGLEPFTTDDPGVWVSSPPLARLSGSGGISVGGVAGEKGLVEEGEEEQRKIAAMGVYLRRHVSGLGVAVNLDMPVTWGSEGRDTRLGGAVGGAATNPWARFVACGLEGKGVTCVAEEVRLRTGRPPPASAVDGDQVARVWAEEFAARLGLAPGSEGVDGASAEEVSEMMAAARAELDAGLPSSSCVSDGP